MTFALRTLVCFLFVLIPSISWAQTLGGGALLQGGPWAQGHSPMYVGQGSSQAIVMDSGPASGGGVGVGLSEQLLVARGIGTPPFIAQGSGPYGTNWCDYDAPTTNPTGYHFLCLSANVHGDAYFAVGPGGMGTPGGLTFNINGIETTYTGAMPTVTSVGADFNTGLITVTNSPITTSGVLHFNVAGNSGGIPYFNSANSWASTPALTADLPLFGGGPGVAPFSGGKTGTTDVLASATGSFVDGDCLSILNGNVIDAGGPCTTGGGGGTVSPGMINQIAWYAATGTTVSGLPTLANGALVTDGSGVPSISVTLPIAVQGNITNLGTISVGTWAGTTIAAIHGGTGLTSFTSGGLIYASTTTTLASSGSYATNAPLFGGGVGAAPVAGSRSGNTTEVATVSGSLTSGDCLKSDVSGNVIDAGSACGGIAFSGTDGGTANARVVSSPGFPLSTNNMIVFTATSTNTGPATANVNTTGVKNIFIQTQSGPAALSGGEIVSGNTIVLVYDGTQYQFINSPSASSTTVYNTTGSHTFSVPANAHTVKAILFAGGGGGSGGGPSAAGTVVGGSGGGGGQAFYTNPITSPTSTISVFVGSGGTGGVGSGAGGTGTNTTFGPYATAYGGKGGVISVAGGDGGGFVAMVAPASGNNGAEGGTGLLQTGGAEYGGGGGGYGTLSPTPGTGGTSLFGGAGGGGGGNKTSSVASAGSAGGATGVLQTTGGGGAGGTGSTVGAGGAGTAGSAGVNQFAGQGGGGGGSSTVSTGGVGGLGGFPSGGGGGGGSGATGGGNGGAGGNGEAIIIVN